MVGFTSLQPLLLLLKNLFLFQIFKFFRHSGQMRWLENHLNLISTYSIALENLDNYRGKGRKIIPGPGYSSDLS